MFALIFILSLHHRKTKTWYHSFWNICRFKCHIFNQLLFCPWQKTRRMAKSAGSAILYLYSFITILLSYIFFSIWHGCITSLGIGFLVLMDGTFLEKEVNLWTTLKFKFLKLDWRENFIKTRQGSLVGSRPFLCSLHHWY